MIDAQAVLRSRLTRLLPAGDGAVGLSQPLPDADCAKLAKWMERHPQLELRASRWFTDLEFLRFFPSLRRFAVVYDFSLQSLEGLRHLPADAESLEVCATTRPLDLAVLGRFHSLKALHLEGQTKGIGVLSELTSLEELTLRSISLPDLSLLRPLERLRWLAIKLGGTNNLGLLPELAPLRYLELWRIRGMTDIGPISGLRQLRYLFLQTLNRVTALPDLGGALRLRRVHLETLHNLRDLQPLASAPALEELALVDMPQLSLADLAPLKQSNSLRRVAIGLGSFARNAEARKLLGLPDIEGGFNWRDD
jgi:hypothetical protein